MGSISDNFQGTMPNLNLYNYGNGLQYSTDQLGSSLAQQQSLVNALQRTASGQGPNPALSELQSATNQNNQQAAGLVASQRGLNPALAARMASEMAANNNQIAANQAATLQANQSLGAQSALGNVLGQMGNQSLQSQQNLLNANDAQNNAINTGSLGSQGLTADAMKTTSQNNAGIMNGIIGGAMKGAGAALALLSKGGEVPGQPSVAGDSPRNDTVPALLSPGEIVIPRSDSNDPKKAKEFIDHLMSNKQNPGEPQGYAKVLASHRKLQERMADIEKKLKGKKA